MEHPSEDNLGGGMRGDGPRGGDRGDRGDRESRGGGGMGRHFGGRRKVCPFVMDKTLVLDYKNIRMLQRFVTETGRIVPRHVTGVNAANQRKLKKFLKRARALGMLAPKAEG